MPAYGGFDCRRYTGQRECKRAGLDSPYSLSFSRGRTSQKRPELLRACLYPWNSPTNPYQLWGDLYVLDDYFKRRAAIVG